MSSWRDLDDEQLLDALMERISTLTKAVHQEAVSLFSRQEVEEKLVRLRDRGLTSALLDMVFQNAPLRSFDPCPVCLEPVTGVVIEGENARMKRATLEPCGHVADIVHFDGSHFSWSDPASN